MLKDTAETVKSELLDRSESPGGLRVAVVDEYEDRDDSRFEYKYHYTVRVFTSSRLDEQTTQLGRTTSGEAIPQWFTEFLHEHDELSVTLERGAPSKAAVPCFFFRLDDGETGDIEKPADVKQREAIRSKIKSQLGINSRPTVDTLAAAFDSFEGIIFADREALLAIDGIGESYSEQIQSRYSDRVRDCIKNHDAGEYTPLLIEDQDGTLRLPEEFESSNHTPSAHTLPVDQS
jgi:hypothetical protein